MKSLTWTDKMLIQKMIIETLERAFDKEISKEIYLVYSEAVFNMVENSEWFQEDNPILVEHIVQIFSALIIAHRQES